MDDWSILLSILVLLGAALAMGVVFERLRQSAIVGYLIAGTLLGPNAFNVVFHSDVVDVIAELGVALLLFSIGLEFSWRRLRRMGAVAAVGGTLQIVLTLLAGVGVALAFGVNGPAATAFGAVAALSSTACVLRVLADRAQVDSVHGRLAVAILIMQDIAVIPLVLIVSALGVGSDGEQPMDVGHILLHLGEELLVAAGMVVALILLINVLLPRLMSLRVMSRNRELPILLAVVVAVGSAFLAQYWGISPALGAFIAGVLLGESPFAMQVRADVGPLRTLFVTLFFSSIGMLGDPAWVVEHVWQVALLVSLAVVIKPVIVWIAARVARQPTRQAIAGGVCLGQLGEFSFVIASVALAAQVFSKDQFMLVISATIVTLLLTPYLVAAAPSVGRFIEGRLARMGLVRETAGEPDELAVERADHVIVIGYGPAGRRVAEAAQRAKGGVTIVDLNPQSVRLARAAGHDAQVGDATRDELLHHLSLSRARAVVVTLPDHRAAIQVIQHIHSFAPTVPIVARARYSAFAADLKSAGATAVVDEEDRVGRRLGVQLRRAMGSTPTTE